MAYRVELFGKVETLTKAQFLALVTSLSRRYISERGDPSRSRATAGVLWGVCKPLFRPWGAVGDKQDYEQTAFLVFSRALDAWDPARGALVAYLRRFTVPTALREHGKDRPIPRVPLADGWDIPGEQEEGPDFLLWARLRASLAPMDYRIMAARVLGGRAMFEIARDMGMGEKELKLHMDALMARCREIWEESGLPTPRGIPRKGWGEDPDTGPIFPPSSPEGSSRGLPPLPI